MYSVGQEKVCDSVNDVDCNIIYEKKCEEGKVFHSSNVLRFALKLIILSPFHSLALFYVHLETKIDQ